MALLAFVGLAAVAGGAFVECRFPEIKSPKSVKPESDFPEPLATVTSTSPRRDAKKIPANKVLLMAHSRFMFQLQNSQTELTPEVALPCWRPTGTGSSPAETIQKTLADFYTLVWIAFWVPFSWWLQLANLPAPLLATRAGSLPENIGSWIGFPQFNRDWIGI